MCPNVDEMVGLAWSNDPESHAGSIVTTDRASLSRRNKGDDPDEKGYSGPPDWWLGVELTSPPHKKYVLLKNF